MAEFLTTKSIQSSIESIITEAKSKIVIVSPFIKLSSYYLESLTHASNRGVIIKILYGKSELHKTVLDDISSLKNVEVYYYEHLHAKCYLNESKMVITSMNLYDASEKNREMGVLVHREADRELFDRAAGEVKLLLESPHTVRLNKPKAAQQPIQKKPNTRKQKHTAKPYKELNGTCVRCGEAIEHDPDKPFCATCYKKWAEHGNPTYKERYCHTCGDHSHTSMEKPECYECYVLEGLL